MHNEIKPFSKSDNFISETKTGCFQNEVFSNSSYSGEFLNYRGIHVDFFYNEKDHSVYIILNGRKIEFGKFDHDYIVKTKLIIDNMLDTIQEFETEIKKYPEFKGATLKYFQNGSRRDIKLELNNRILKVFLVEVDSISKDILYNIIRQSIEFLQTFFKHTKPTVINESTVKKIDV